MTDWTKPKAYIVHMSGRQTAELTRAAHHEMERRYKEWFAEILKKAGF